MISIPLRILALHRQMFDLLMKQYAEREGVTEELKAKNQMTWVQRMNSIRERVEEVITAELVMQ